MTIAARLALALAGTAVVLAAGTLWACAGAGCAAGGWEFAVLAWFEERRGPVMDVLLGTATWLGSLYLLLPLALAAAAVLVAMGRRADAARFAVAFGGATLIAHALKPAVGRARPPGGADLLAAMPSDASFPSAHAMQGTAFVLAALFAFVPRCRLPAVVAPAVAVIAIVGLSRLYLQVHFPTDVVVGTAAGAIWVLAVMGTGKPRHA